MSEEDAAETAPPYGLGAMLEDTLTAPLRPFAIFDGLARKPAPDYGVMLINLLVFWTVMFGVNFVHAAVSDPALVARFGPAVGGLMLLCAIFLVVLFSFVAAGVLHIFCLLAGASAGYIRSYQIVSTLSLLAPLQALVSWIPGLWPLPAILGTCLAAVGAERLHDSPPLRTRLLFGGVAAFGLLASWAVRAELEKAMAPYQAMNQTLQTLRAMPAAAPAGGIEPANLAPVIQAAPASAPTTAAETPMSGLDMLKSAAPGRNVPQQPGMPDAQQLDAIRQNGANMINSLMPMLQNPNLTKDMPPEQARQVQNLVKTISDMQGNLQSGKPMTPQQQAQMLQLMQQVMQNAQQASPPPGQQPQGGGQ